MTICKDVYATRKGQRVSCELEKGHEGVHRWGDLMTNGTVVEWTSDSPPIESWSTIFPKEA